MGGNLDQGRKSLIITCSESLNHRLYSSLSHIKYDQIFQGDVFGPGMSSRSIIQGEAHPFSFDVSL